MSSRCCSSSPISSRSDRRRSPPSRRSTPLPRPPWEQAGENMTELQLPPSPYSTPPPNYLNARHGVWSWLFTRDHKRIALLYLISVTFFFFIGALFAAAIRLELLTPPGELVKSDTYNK